LPRREHAGAGCGPHAVTLACYTRNGMVFSAGTTDRAQPLAQDARVARNAIEHLLDARAPS
jgi:hypothetical protein